MTTGAGAAKENPDIVVRWECCSFIRGAAGMGDRVHFSLNGISVGLRLRCHILCWSQ